MRFLKRVLALFFVIFIFLMMTGVFLPTLMSTDRLPLWMILLAGLGMIVGMIAVIALFFGVHVRYVRDK